MADKVAAPSQEQLGKDEVEGASSSFIRGGEKKSKEESGKDKSKKKSSLKKKPKSDKEEDTKESKKEGKKATKKESDKESKKGSKTESKKDAKSKSGSESDVKHTDSGKGSSTTVESDLSGLSGKDHHEKKHKKMKFGLFRKSKSKKHAEHTGTGPVVQSDPKPPTPAESAISDVQEGSGDAEKASEAETPNVNVSLDEGQKVEPTDHSHTVSMVTQDTPDQPPTGVDQSVVPEAEPVEKTELRKSLDDIIAGIQKAKESLTEFCEDDPKDGDQQPVGETSEHLLSDITGVSEVSNHDIGKDQLASDGGSREVVLPRVEISVELQSKGETPEKDAGDDHDLEAMSEEAKTGEVNSEGEKPEGKDSALGQEITSQGDLNDQQYTANVAGDDSAAAGEETERQFSVGEKAVNGQEKEENGGDSESKDTGVIGEIPRNDQANISETAQNEEEQKKEEEVHETEATAEKQRTSQEHDTSYLSLGNHEDKSGVPDKHDTESEQKKSLDTSMNASKRRAMVSLKLCGCCTLL